MNFPEKLMEKVNEEIREREGQLATGMASDWADYRYRCGILAGLRDAKRWINDMQEV